MERKNRSFTPAQIGNPLTAVGQLVRGFTLTEVLLAVVIMGIVAAVVLPRFFQGTFLQDFELRTTAFEIASDMRSARQLAVTNATNYLVSFNFSKNEYGIYRQAVQPENLTGQIKKIPAEIVCSGTAQFDFSTLGSCSFSGSGLSLTRGVRQYQLIVEPPSGAVVVEKIS